MAQKQPADPAPSTERLRDPAEVRYQTELAALAATDSDTDPLTYGATGLPPGLTINSGTGLISGTPSAS